MTQRLKTAGLALAILILGMGITVAVTEHQAGADAADPRLLTATDVLSTLDSRGLDIAPEQRPAHHALLGIAGTTILAGMSSIEVYVYPDLTSRVVDEQVIQRYVMQAQAFTTAGGEPLRVTSARNLLLLFQAESADHAALIYDAARVLASGAES